MVSDMTVTTSAVVIDLAGREKTAAFVSTSDIVRTCTLLIFLSVRKE
jgi:hypothetical protein